MVAAKTIQLIWAIMLGSAYIPRMFASPSMGAFILGSIAIALLISAFGCLANIRIFWVLAIVIMSIVLIRWLPMVAMNTFMAFSGHELYRDSPATLMIVMIYAVIYVIPPVTVLTCLAGDWRNFFAMMSKRSSKNVESGDFPKKKPAILNTKLQCSASSHE